MKQLQTFLLIFIAICHCGIASGQTSIEENEIVRASLDEMFDNLDKTKIPTGLLLDYAVDLVDFSKFDGISLTDSNYVHCEQITYKKAYPGGQGVRAYSPILVSPPVTESIM